jgi:hypothetical protein
MAAPLRPRRRLYVEAALAALGLALFVLTLVLRDWIEKIFGVDPDAGNGSFEYLISIGLVVVTLAATFLVRAEWRRWRAVTTPG